MDPTLPGALKAELIYRGLARTIETLQRAGKNVVLLGDVPELPFFPKDCVPRPASHLFERHCLLDRGTFDLRRQALDEVYRRVLAAYPAVTFFDLSSVLCDRLACHFEADGIMLYRDSTHLTGSGSERVAMHLLSWLDNPAAAADRASDGKRP